MTKKYELINDVILPYDEDFDFDLYDRQWLSLQLVKDMFAVKMKPMHFQGFVAWASNKLLFSKSESVVRERATFFSVLLLWPKYKGMLFYKEKLGKVYSFNLSLDTILTSITSRNKAMSLHLNQLKLAHTIVGYCRKSPWERIFSC